jgi:hypothetical protein
MTGEIPTPESVSALLETFTDRTGQPPSCFPWSDTAVIVTWDLVAGIKSAAATAAEYALLAAGYRVQHGWNAQEGTRLIVTADPDREDRCHA